MPAVKNTVCYEINFGFYKGGTAGPVRLGQIPAGAIITRAFIACFAGITSSGPISVGTSVQNNLFVPPLDSGTLNSPGALSPDNTDLRFMDNSLNVLLFLGGNVTTGYLKIYIDWYFPTTPALANVPYFPSSPTGLLVQKVSLTAAQIQTGNSIPVPTGITNPGPGKAVQITQTTSFYNFGTVPFTSNTAYILYLPNVFPNSPFSTNLEFGNPASNSAFGSFYGNITTNVLPNVAPVITVDSDSPGVGDGTAVIYITYSILTL